ncbi:MAG: hypothetical protein ACOCQR_03565 [bacterium]
MFKFIEKRSEDIEKMQYRKPEKDGFAVLNDDNEEVAYIWFILKDKTMDIEMLEVIDKGKGIGRKIIEFIFNNFSIDIIEGRSLYEQSLRSFYFWESLGAEFAWSPDGIKYEDIPFSLSKDFFIN